MFMSACYVPSHLVIFNWLINIVDASLITEEPRGKDKVWIIGDNWLAETFRPCFKKMKDYTYYLKQNFEVVCYCSSKYNDKNQNVISRLQITMAAAINKEKHLPKFIIVLLDDELIRYLIKSATLIHLMT